MNKYSYELYHLKVISNIEITELTQINNITENYDVQIIAQMSQNSLILETENKLEVSDNYFYLCIKNVAIYEIKDKKTISIEYHPSASPEEIYLYLLGSCMGIILFQKGLFPLHASSIYLPDKGSIFFTGESGAGKSTTLNSFLQRGYQMVSDDVSALNVNDKESIIYPSFPRTKIWQDSADKLNINTLKLSKIHRDMNKYSYILNKDQFYNKISKPYTLYEINKYSGDKVYLEEVKYLKKIDILYKNTYRFEYIKLLKKGQEHFKQITTLAKQIKIKKVYRPSDKNSILEIVDLIESDFKND